MNDATSLHRRLSEIESLASMVADEYDDVRMVTDLADRGVTGMLKALRGVLVLAEKWEGCADENAPLATDGSWMAAGYASAYRLAATNLRATIDAAIRTTEPDELDRLVSAVDAGRDSFQRAQLRAMGGAL